MKVREFSLLDDLGNEYSLMDIDNYCLLTEPKGLGYGYNTEYEQVGDTFVTNLRKIGQGQINGTLNFLTYDNYKALVDFLERADSLRFKYVIPYKEGTKTFYKNINIASFEKSEIQPNGIISEPISFDGLSLWYSPNTATFDMGATGDEIRWDFRWDSRFSDKSDRTINFVNEGQSEARVKIEIDGECVQPVIKLDIDGETYQEIDINTTIEEGEKLIYSSVENEFEISRLNTNGTKSNLFNTSYLNPTQNLCIKLPQNKNCSLTLTTLLGTDVPSGTITIYEYYKAV